MNVLTKWLHDKENPVLQFFKYSVCGSLSLAVDMLLFFLMAWLVFPALTEKDFLVRLFHMQLDAEMLTTGARTFNFVMCNLIAFMVSNLVAYITNVLFVFKAGKHSRTKELLLFYAVSAISVGLGTAIGGSLVYLFDMSATVPYIAKAISTVLINYVVRKYLIFNG